ncbi:MAG: D-alanyl-D-alanine carboxypeptidase [Verrucomicrobiaceae bacterium]|nr:D-alanyl-D-alanine carboxypeptidase [Verrucomicrobiaceae bacterium]
MTAVLPRLASFLLITAFVPLAGAQSIIVVDTYNKKIHVGGNISQKRAVGGIAKIATAMVALDWADASKVSLNVLATVPTYAEQIAGERVHDLRTGDRVTLRDLLYATMMSSDNVAAITLGHFVGGDLLRRKQVGGDPLQEFVTQMNALAAREGCRNTMFVTPHGYENSRPTPYSTAADIARIGIYAASRAPFHFYTNQQSRRITIYRGEARVPITVNNTNGLLGNSRIDGMKVASTPASGGCAVITADKPATLIPQPDGSNIVFRHRLVVVVLGSGSPQQQALGALQQGWGAYDQWLNAGRPITDRSQLLQFLQD